MILRPLEGLQPSDWSAKVIQNFNLTESLFVLIRSFSVHEIANGKIHVNRILESRHFEFLDFTLCETDAA